MKSVYEAQWHKENKKHITKVMLKLTRLHFEHQGLVT
jgi:hypothetical protein